MFRFDGIEPDVTDTNIRFQDLLRLSHEQTRKRAVVIVDEYDNFILHCMGDKEMVNLARQRFQNLFGPLKEMDDHLPTFIEAIKTFFAAVPYQLDNGNEHHYHALLYTLLTDFGADVSAEESSAKDRADLVLRMPKTIYVIEIKYNGSAQQALDQIEEKGYAEKYRLDGRNIVKVGVNFSSKDRNIGSWLINS